MKILLSAYAFAPRGSEPAIGWNWAMTLVERGHEVWVLARAQGNRESVEDYKREQGLPEALHIVYVGWPYDLEKTFVNRLPLNYYWHYFAWQEYAYEEAARLHREHQFDLVQHITWGSLRSPSCMGRLGIPFIFGPVGGGEHTPQNLRGVLGVRGRFEEMIRDKTVALDVARPKMTKVFDRAEKIYVTSEQGKALIPSPFSDKTDVSLAIGFAGSLVPEPVARKSGVARKLLYVGRFLNWKGMKLGLQAFARALETMPELHMTMVGSGPEEARWREQARALGIDDRIEWISWIDQKELWAIYQNHDLFVFPSFHDSGGMVILEAMSFGLPVLCLDLGGPGVMVNKACGRVISTPEKTSDEVVQDLSGAVVEIAQSPELFEKLSAGAQERVRDFTWDKVVGGVYEEFERQLGVEEKT